MITRVDTDEFLRLAQQHPVLDVRSPGEYAHAHIPGAFSLPLFSDEERKVTGTIYKQQSREKAIKAGLDFYGPKMRPMVEQAEAILKSRGKGKTLLIHCWRGGMRSAGVAWLMDLYGFKVYTLAGGYKAYRQWVLKKVAAPYRYCVIGGYTGSGKTAILQQLAKRGEQILDLEGAAGHRGSAFGALGMPAQPGQEQFENTLAMSLSHADPARSIWIEDESRRIGNVNVPAGLWEHLRKGHVYFLDIPVTERLALIVKDYGRYRIEELAANIMRIRKRLGGLATRDALGYLAEGNHQDCFRILLTYYDRFYRHDIQSRDNYDLQVTHLQTDSTDAAANAALLMETSSRHD